MIAVITGTRPELIKLAPVLWELEAQGVPHTWVHVGQHYDPNMSDVFIDEVVGRRPDFCFNEPVAGFGKMLCEIRSRLKLSIPVDQTQAVIIQGDTTTVLAGALFANDNGIAIAHVEAGLRSNDIRMPEEVIRTTVDHMSRWLFAPTSIAAENLANEIVGGYAPAMILEPGHTIADVVFKFLKKLSLTQIPKWVKKFPPKGFVLVTLHRRDNLYVKRRLHVIFGVLKELVEHGIPVVFPVHPHTYRLLEWAGMLGYLEYFDHIPPQSFESFLRLEKLAGAIITDSGGVQEEAYLVRTPCITIGDTTERPETIEAGANSLFKPLDDSPSELVERVLNSIHEGGLWNVEHYGDGSAGKRIVETLKDSCGI